MVERLLDLGRHLVEREVPVGGPQPAELERPLLAGDAQQVEGGRGVDDPDERGGGDQRALLRMHRAARRQAPRVVEGAGSQHLSVGIHFQREGVRDPWIVGDPFVLAGEGLVRMSDEHRVRVPPGRLNHPDPYAVLGDQVRVLGQAGPRVLRVDLLPKNAAPQSPVGLPQRGASVRGDGRVQHRVRQQRGVRVPRVILRGQLPAHRSRPDVPPGVEPGPGVDRRHVEARLPDGEGDTVVQARLRVLLEGLGVPLLHAAEALELALHPVEGAVVIAVAGHQLGAGQVIDALGRLHQVDREGEPADPRPPLPLIPQVEVGGARVADAGGRTQVVVDPRQQMRLRPAGEVVEAVLDALLAGRGPRRHDAGGALPQHVGDLQVVQAIDRPGKEDGQRG